MSKTVKASSNDQITLSPKTVALIRKAAACDGQPDAAIWLSKLIESGVDAALGNDKP